MLWTADGKRGLYRQNERLLAGPCTAVCAAGGQVFAAFQGQGVAIDRATGRETHRFPLPAAVARLMMLGGRLCALSSDCDCIWALEPESGRLLLSAPAGIYPRDACPSPCSGYAAIAGSAAGEVMILDRDLHCIRREKVAGAAVSVGFLPRAVAVLCAMGEENITTRLLLISQRGVTEEIYTCPQPPCTLCTLPDGRLYAGVSGSVLHFSAAGRLTGRSPCVWPCRILPVQGGFLHADSWLGEVRDQNGRCLFRGDEPRDISAP